MTTSDEAGGMVAAAQQWDLHSKLVITAGLPATLAYAGVDLDASRLVVLPTELPATVRTADLLFATDDGSVVVQIEIQHRPDPWMGLRMTGYGARIAADPAYRDRVRDLVQIVVQVTGQAMGTEFRLGGLSNRFRLVHIPSIPVGQLLAAPGLAPFAMVSGKVDVVAPMVARIAEADDAGLRASMVALAIGLAPIASDVIMDELRRNRMTDVIKELASTDWGRGLIAEGREEGREEGRKEALAAGVVDVLGARFPDGDAEAVQRTARRLVAEGGRPLRAALDIAHLDRAD